MLLGNANHVLLIPHGMLHREYANRAHTIIHVSQDFSSTQLLKNARQRRVLKIITSIKLLINARNVLLALIITLL